METLQDLFGEVISAYTRAMALEDGTLIDVAKLAQTSPRLQAALKPFKYPMAATPAALAYMAQTYPQRDRLEALAEVLHLAAFMAVMCGNLDRIRPQGPLILHIGPGDDAAPVFTLMMPEDD